MVRSKGTSLCIMLFGIAMSALLVYQFLTSPCSDVRVISVGIVAPIPFLAVLVGVCIMRGGCDAREPEEVPRLSEVIVAVTDTADGEGEQPRQENASQR